MKCTHSHATLFVFVPARPAQVICLDNFFTGSKDNIAHHIGNPRFELIRHDVVEPVLLEVDQIYHLVRRCKLTSA